MTRLADDVNLNIYDDGSLTEDDLRRLTDSIENLVIHSFDDYYEHVSELLSKYPTCLDYRKKSPFALKLLDLPLNSPDTFVNLDSDIYFFKPFKDINRSKIEDPDYVASRDPVDHCYGLTWQERYFNKKIPKIPDKLNAGFIYMNKRIYDLDYIEWLLETILDVKKSHYPREAEQFVFAGLAANKKTFVWSHKQIFAPHPFKELSDSTIALHFHSHIRNKLRPTIDKYNLQGKSDLYSQTLKLVLEPATYHSLARFAIEGIARRMIFYFKD